MFALAMVIGKGLADRVGVVFHGFVGKSAEVLVSKHVFVSNSPKKYHANFWSIFILDVSGLKGVLCGAKNVLNSDRRSFVHVVTTPFSIFPFGKKLAHQDTLSQDIPLELIFRTQTPFHLGRESCGSAKVLNGHSPRAFEHTRHRPMRFGPSLFGTSWNPIGRANDKISAFGTFRSLVENNDGKPTNDDQTISEKNGNKIGSFEFFTQQRLEETATAIVGSIILFVGFFLLSSGISTFLGVALIFCGGFVSLYMPRSWLFWWAG